MSFVQAFSSHQVHQSLRKTWESQLGSFKSAALSLQPCNVTLSFTGFTGFRCGLLNRRCLQMGRLRSVRSDRCTMKNWIRKFWSATFTCSRNVAPLLGYRLMMVPFHAVKFSDSQMLLWICLMLVADHHDGESVTEGRIACIGCEIGLKWNHFQWFRTD